MYEVDYGYLLLAETQAATTEQPSRSGWLRQLADYIAIMIR